MPRTLDFKAYFCPMGDALRTYSERYTIADWEQWNDPWELVHGFPYCMSPAPGYRHQYISTLILTELTTQLKGCRTCKALMPIDWQIDDFTVVQPDILVLCKPLFGDRLREAPSMVFEILSPSTRKKDQTVKFDLYQTQGVRYYLMVDPENQVVQAFENNPTAGFFPLPTDGPLILQLADCQIKLDMAELWDQMGDF